MSQFTIFDCDNVLADDAWRIPLIRWNTQAMDLRYHSYHLASAYDAPGNRQLLRTLRSEDVIIFTAMPEQYRTLRQLWFNHNRLGYNRIYMRPATDHSHSAQVKCNMLHKFYRDFGVGPQNVRIAYDDRQDVVDMYTAQGIKAELVCIHNVSAYKPPVLEKT